VPLGYAERIYWWHVQSTCRCRLVSIYIMVLKLDHTVCDFQYDGTVSIGLSYEAGLQASPSLCCCLKHCRVWSGQSIKHSSLFLGSKSTMNTYLMPNSSVLNDVEQNLSKIVSRMATFDFPKCNECGTKFQSTSPPFCHPMGRNRHEWPSINIWPHIRG